jgi:hypothetical protein
MSSLTIKSGACAPANLPNLGQGGHNTMGPSRRRLELYEVSHVHEFSGLLQRQ